MRRAGLRLCALLLMAAPFASAQSFVSGSGAATGGTGTSISLTIPSTTAGDLLIFAVSITSSSATVSNAACGGQTLTASSNSPVTRPAGPIRIYFYYILSANGSQTSCTATISTSTNWSAISTQYTISGGGTWSALNNSGGNANSSSLSVTSFTPSQTPAVVVASGHMFVTGGSFTAGSGYTIGASCTSCGQQKMAQEYNLSVSAATTAPITSSNSGDWVEIAQAFKATASGGGGGGAIFLPLIGVGSVLFAILLGYSFSKAHRNPLPMLSVRYAARNYNRRSQK